MDALQFERLWGRAVLETPPSAEGATGELVNAMASALDVEQVQFTQSNDAAIFLMDLGMYGFKRLGLNTLLVIHPPRERQHLEEIARILNQYTDFVKAQDLCLALVLAPTVERNFPAEALGDNVVPFARNDLRRLLTESFPQAVLFDIIQRRHQLEPECPFSSWQIARGAMFHGRQIELNDILSEEDTPFAVTGARRIGKSSLLIKAIQQMRLRKQYSGRVHSFVCLNWISGMDAFEQIAEKLDPQAVPRITHGGTHNFVNMLERVSEEGKRPHHIFLDEADGLIELDAATNWLFFRAMIEASERGFVRMGVGGYRAVDQLQLGDSPFHRKIKPIMLGALDEQSTRSLIISPFVASGFQIENRTEIGDLIWKFTRGFPHLIQFFGEQIFRFAVNRTPRLVLTQDAIAVHENPGFASFTFEHFLQNTLNKNGSPVRLERFCAALLAEAPENTCWNQETFLDNILERGERWFPNSPKLRDELHAALRRLCETGILSLTMDGYSLSMPIYRKVISKEYPDPIRIFA